MINILIISAFYKKQKKSDSMIHLYLTILFSLVFGSKDGYKMRVIIIYVINNYIL